MADPRGQALRGAGASFGIVTTFTVITHPEPTTTTHYSFQVTFGSPAELAAAFTKWQTFVSSPAVANDRAFNSIITIANGAVLMQGSRFGTKDELERSEAIILLKNTFLDVDVKIWELDWLASTVYWASDMINTIAGGLVRACSLKGAG